MRFRARIGFALGIAACAAAVFPQPASNLSVELRELDPQGNDALPPFTPVYGRIGYTAGSPVRAVLRPYRNGQPVVEGVSYSGSPMHQPPGGEAMAWFTFATPGTIDEVRAILTDAAGIELVSASRHIDIVWSVGAAPPPVAGWVATLEARQDALVRQQARVVEDDLGTTFFVQLLFLSVPASVILQFVALRKLRGTARSVAGYSAVAMAALWLFVIVTALAGSNLSPIWIVFLSPVFVVLLSALLALQYRAHRKTATPLN